MSTRRESPSEKAPVRAVGLRYILSSRFSKSNIKNFQNIPYRALSTCYSGINVCYHRFSINRPSAPFGRAISSFGLRQAYENWIEKLPLRTEAVYAWTEHGGGSFICDESCVLPVFQPRFFGSIYSTVSECFRENGILVETQEIGDDL